MHRTTAQALASALLGVLAIAALISGTLFLLGAWATGQLPNATPVFRIGTATSALIGILTLGLAALAGSAARDVWALRPRGTVIGLVASIVALLGTGVPLVTGAGAGSPALLALGVGVSAVTTAVVGIALLQATRSEGATQ